VLHDGHAATDEELKQFFLARGPAYAHPRRVFFVEAVPLGSTGKVDRLALRKRAQEMVGVLKGGA